MSFLAPQDRTLLLESLRPPEDFQVDVAISTTYSLDLVALMVAPVGFTLFDIDPNDPTFLKRDPLELLEAVRRHANQVVLFHEAGRIAVPREYRPIFSYLEGRVIPVVAPTRNRSFHPKAWFIRYANVTGRVCYRLLCLSRNLTFDRCWDTILILDGELRQDRKVGFGYNDRLSDFVAALPGMATVAVNEGVREQVRKVASEIARVEWDMGDLPFEEIEFWPLGYDGRKRWPFKGRLERLAVVSPFLSDKTLAKLSEGTGEHVLISRRECLDKVAPETLEGFAQAYQMSDAIPGAEAEDPEQLPSSEAPLRGLHAKLYVADDGWDARVWTGSANATVSAFDGNVEFLVELIGKKSEVGVSCLLEKIKGSTSFLDLLEPYQAPEAPVRNTVLEALEEELDALRKPIATAGWTVSVAPVEGGQQWTPVVATMEALPEWGGHISVSCRPASLAEPSSRALVQRHKVSEQFDPVALETLTSFVIVEMAARSGKEQLNVRFLINAELLGAPANRQDRLLRHMLRDKRSVLRFLLLLLSDFADSIAGDENGSSGSWKGRFTEAAESEALLEPLLRALDRSPARLAAISTLLTELGSTDEGRALIPEGLPELFSSLWSAKDLVHK